MPVKISPEEGKIIISGAHVSSPGPFKAQPPSTPADTCSQGLASPTSIFPLVLKGETPHRYLKRHLEHPGLHGPTNQEKQVWLNLHKIEHERLLTTLG